MWFENVIIIPGHSNLYCNEEKQIFLIHFAGQKLLSHGYMK